MTANPTGNWLITGGCGFVGSTLARRLRAGGCRVRVYDDLSVGTRAALPGDGWAELEAGRPHPEWTGAELVVADIRDRTAARAAAQGADVVIHLAARTGVIPSIKDPHDDCDVNVLGTLNMLEAARDGGARRFVMASSSAPLGAAKPPYHEDLAPRPLSPYGASKLAGEAYCSAFFQSYDLDALALRISNVYGPGSDHKNSVVAQFFKHAFDKGYLTIYGDGDQTRDFIYIDDLIEAFLLAAERPGLGGEPVHVAAGRTHTVKELAEKIAALMGEQAGRRIELRHEPARAGELVRFQVRLDMARQKLGFEAAMDFDEGLRTTMTYFLSLSGRV